MKILKIRGGMEMMALAAILMMSLLLSGCRGKGTNVEEELPYHGPPTITVFLVPMDGISTADAEKLKSDFMKNFAARQFEPYNVEVLDHMSTPDSCLNDAKTRLRADKMLRTLKGRYSEEAKRKAKAKDPKAWDYHIVGVTNKDISTSVHGKADYGILGLSFLGHKHGDSSVVSTYRLKRKKDLWKLTAHEFCHGFYGCPHCKNDDPHCLMADAKGGNPHFEIKDSLCGDCANIRLIGD